MRKPAYAEKAAQAMHEEKTLQPGFCPLACVRTGIAFEHADDLDHLIEGLQKAAIQGRLQ